jgi:hypothetical protein
MVDTASGTPVVGHVENGWGKVADPDAGVGFGYVPNVWSFRIGEARASNLAGGRGLSGLRRATRSGAS